MHILIANKDLLSTKAFAAYLSTLGHEIESCTSLDQISEIINTNAPEIIILGYFWNPHELIHWLKMLRQKKLTSSIKFILLVSQKTTQLKISRELGIWGLIHYDEDISTLSDCITQLKNNNYYLPPQLHQINIEVSVSNISILTPTEKKIILKIHEGKSTKEIASDLFRSIETVQNHRKSIKQKLKIKGGKSSLIIYIENHLASNDNIA